MSASQRPTVWRVTAEYAEHGGYTKTWRFLAKRAAGRNAERWRRGFTIEAGWPGDDDRTFPPAKNVTVEAGVIEWLPVEESP